MAKRIRSSTNSKLYQYKAGGNYYFRFSRAEFCLETSDEAQAIKNMALQESLLSRFGTKAFKFKIRDLFPKFLDAKEKEVRASTFKGYQSIYFTYFEKRLGKVALGNMNQREWENFTKSEKGVSDFQNLRNLMHQFLVWCSTKELILAVPVLQNPKHKRRKRKIIPPQHLKAIFNRAHGSLLLFLSMAFLMGMRRKEVMTLGWDRVDFENRSLLLRDEDTKTDEGRELPINSVVLSLLINRLKEQQDQGIKTKWVFPNAKSPRRHASLEGLMTAWRWCLLDCGLAEKVYTNGNKSKYKIVVEYTWHDARATYEKYSHMSKDYTETQKEKMVGADIDVQKRIYVSMNADDLRGLEEVVSSQLPELAQIVDRKTIVQKVQLGNEVGNKKLKTPYKAITNE